MKKLCAVLAGAALLVSGLAIEATAATRYVTIGTGGVTGVYYPAGGAISKLVNAKRKEYNLRMTVESTGGSVFNVNAIANGDLEMGVVQSDLQYQAYNGKGQWEGKPVKKLRAMFSLHPEAVTILAAADKNIHTVADMKGKIVNIGAPGTGQRVNALDLFNAMGINPETDLTAEGIKPAEAASMLQDGRIDAYFYTVGHPNGSIKEAVAGTRKVNFVAGPGRGGGQADQGDALLRPGLHPGGRLPRRGQHRERADLRRQGDHLHLGRRPRRRGLRHHQGGVREHRPAQDPASGPGGADQGEHAPGPLGPAPSRGRSSTSRKSA